MSGRRLPPRRVLNSLGLLIGVAGVGFVARILVSQWDQVATALRTADFGLLAGAFAIAAVGMTQIGLGWRRCLMLLGGRRPLPLADTLHWYFVGQLGKYIPGGIWPVLGRSEMARRGGISGQESYVSTLMSLGVTYLAAIVLALALLPFSIGRESGTETTHIWVLALLPIGLALLHPVILTRLFRLVERLSGRTMRVSPPDWWTMLRVLARHIPAWLAIGLATWMVGNALHTPGELSNILFATALSWVVGFVVIPVPGGIGVREAVFVAAAISLPTALAATVALSTRVLFVLVDLTGAAVTSAVRRTSTARR